MHKKIIFILVLVFIPFILSSCSDVPSELEEPKFKTGLDENETRLSSFKELFPEQFASYQKNNESEIMTEYKGSVNYSKNDNTNNLPEGFKNAQPYLKNLWLGYAFSFEYNEARGHTTAVKDFLEIDRIDRFKDSGKGGLPATCWTCKTPNMKKWVGEYGDGFWATDVNEFRDKIDVEDETINCASCHNPSNMELRTISVPLDDYLASQGTVFDELSRQDQRELICAQCHVEYYFQPASMGVAAKPIFPWKDGFDPEDIYKYYDTAGDSKIEGFEGKFVDWVHPVSKTPMLKVQHPEYETWKNSSHGMAGVTCVDCHMPYVKEDGKKISSHWMTSPMKDPEMRACRQCHSDKSPEQLKERVLFTQDKSFKQLLIAQEISVKAHEAVRLASEYTGSKNKDYKQLLIESREMVRKGQFFWDYVSAEGSVGFHNPQKALDTLAQSQQFSQKAIDLAAQATNYGISKNLEGDIKKIVPPIVEYNRKLAQDKELMNSHVWLKYLPVLPKADIVWDGEKRIEK